MRRQWQECKRNPSWVDPSHKEQAHCGHRKGEMSQLAIASNVNFDSSNRRSIVAFAVVAVGGGPVFGIWIRV